MTRTFDRAFVAMGVNADDLSRVRGRKIIYLGLSLMVLGTLALGAAIVSNLAG